MELRSQDNARHERLEREAREREARLDREREERRRERREEREEAARRADERMFMMMSAFGIRGGDRALPLSGGNSDPAAKSSSGSSSV